MNFSTAPLTQESIFIGRKIVLPQAEDRTNKVPALQNIDDYPDLQFLISTVQQRVEVQAKEEELRRECQSTCLSILQSLGKNTGLVYQAPGNGPSIMVRMREKKPSPKSVEKYPDLDSCLQDAESCLQRIRLEKAEELKQIEIRRKGLQAQLEALERMEQSVLEKSQLWEQYQSYLKEAESLIASYTTLEPELVVSLGALNN